MTKGRETWKCTECGLRLSGRMMSDGTIYPYDRAPDNGGPVHDCLCMECATKIGAIPAEPHPPS
jgi:hypothetical protein